MKQKSKKLLAKDLVTIGIFTAPYMVACVVFEVLGGLGPLVWVFMPTFLGLLCGPIYITLARKVQKFGVPLLMSLIPALIFSVRGGYFFVLITTTLIAGLMGEWIRKIMGYDTEKGNILSYAVFSLGMVGNLLPLWLFRRDFLQSMVMRGMPEDYVQAMESVTPLWTLLMMIAVTFVLALIGGQIGSTLVKKHLRKAGMVK